MKDSEKELNNNILFITDEYFDKTGGGVYLKSVIDQIRMIDNLGSLHVYFPYYSEKYFCVDKSFVFNYEERPSSIKMLLNHLGHRPYVFSQKAIDCCVEIIFKEQIDTVFIGRSFYGYLAQIIKKKYPNVTIISFFHDIAYDVLLELIRIKNKSIKKYVLTLIQYQNEKYSALFSDKTVVLSNREKLHYERCFHDSPTSVIPIYMKDRLIRNRIEKTNDICTLIFVGSAFWPNIHGIRWFCENVIGKLDVTCELFVIGRGMENYKDELESKSNSITVVGTADELDSWYYKADIVVAPIFYGTGMKTKTMEALMMGKFFLGTKEAISGYEKMNEYECNNSDDFINKIHAYCSQKRQYKYDEWNRSIYVDYYSDDVFSDRLRNLITE